MQAGARASGPEAVGADEEKVHVPGEDQAGNGWPGRRSAAQPVAQSGAAVVYSTHSPSAGTQLLYRSVHFQLGTHPPSAWYKRIIAEGANPREGTQVKT